MNNPWPQLPNNNLSARRHSANPALAFGKGTVDLPFNAKSALAEQTEIVHPVTVFSEADHNKSDMRSFIAQRCGISLDELSTMISRFNRIPLSVGPPGHKATRVFTQFRCKKEIADVILGSLYSGKIFTLNSKATKTE